MKAELTRPFHPSACILLQTAQAAAQQPHVAQVLVALRRVLPVLLPHPHFDVDFVAACGGGEAAEILQIQRPLVDEDRLRGFGQVEGRCVWPKAVHHRSLGQRPR